MTVYKIYFDGACNNTGNKTMGIGLVVFRDGELYYDLAHNAGKGTSNIAEWIGCVLAMKAGMLLAREEECEIQIYSDSQLVVNQFLGIWTIKKDNFLPYVRKATAYKKEMKSKFKFIKWIKRDLNKEADKMSKIGVNIKEKTLQNL